MSAGALASAPASPRPDPDPDPDPDRVVDDSSGYELPVGTYEEARAMIGARDEVGFGANDVTWALIKYFCAMVRDGNASYWDEDFAREQWGGVISPPALLMTWVMAPEWRPGGGPPKTLLTARVPLPGNTVISTGCEAELFRPIRVGDRLNVEEELVDVSELKRTRLGDGHFITTVATYRTGDGTTVARYTHVLFRYTPAADPA
jgi:acyl dehydratase